MVFGQKSAAAVVSDAAPTTFMPVLPEMAAAERHAAVRDVMRRILRDATEVSAAIKTDGRFPLRGVADVFDPRAAPISILDLQEQFSFRMNGHLMHAYYVYAPPQRADEFDANAQFHLHDLVLRIRALNIYCQQAERDEALGVALQSPLLPPLVDAILASAAFFVAFFDTIALMDPFLTQGTPAPADRERPSVAQMRETLDRCKLMAFDAMIVPERLEQLVPKVTWPFLGVELVRRDEPGDQFAHGIYFPAEYASRLAGGAGEARYLREITGTPTSDAPPLVSWVA